MQEESAKCIDDSDQLFTSPVQISQHHVRTPESGSSSREKKREDLELTEIKSLLPDGVRDLKVSVSYRKT